MSTSICCCSTSAICSHSFHAEGENQQRNENQILEKNPVYQEALACVERSGFAASHKALRCFDIVLKSSKDIAPASLAQLHRQRAEEYLKVGTLGMAVKEWLRYRELSPRMSPKETVEFLTDVAVAALDKKNDRTGWRQFMVRDVYNVGIKLLGTNSPLIHSRQEAYMFLGDWESAEGDLLIMEKNLSPYFQNVQSKKKNAIATTDSSNSLWNDSERINAMGFVMHYYRYIGNYEKAEQICQNLLSASKVADYAGNEEERRAHIEAFSDFYETTRNLRKTLRQGQDVQEESPVLQVALKAIALKFQGKFSEAAETLRKAAPMPKKVRIEGESYAYLKLELNRLLQPLLKAPKAVRPLLNREIDQVRWEARLNKMFGVRS